MGIRAEIETAINAAFDAFGDLPLACTFKEFTGGTYDAATDTIVNSETTVVTEAFCFDFNHDERGVDQTIEPKDKKLVVKATSISSMPQVEDTLTVGGTDYTVRRISVPVDGIWIIQGSPLA